MAISYINTGEVEEVANNIISLAMDFNTEINNLFSRLSDVPSITREWVGTQSKFYFKKIASDKKQYNDFADNLRHIGYKLSKDIYEIQTCMNNNYREEAR